MAGSLGPSLIEKREGANRLLYVALWLLGLTQIADSETSF